MTPKANILRASIPYIRVWGHCSPGLQSITFRVCISALGTDKTILLEGLEQEQDLSYPRISQWPLVPCAQSLLPTGIVETQPAVQLCVPHYIGPVPPLERQALTR